MTAPVRPTLAQLIDRIQMDMEYHLDGANARAEESLLNTLAQANAGAFHGLYGYAEYLAKQQLPDTADLDWLARWATVLEVPRLAATFASGYVTASGNGVLPAETLLIDPVTRLTFRTTSQRIITDGATNTVPVEAVSTGYSSNLNTGTILQLQSPVLGISPNLIITTLGGGAELETEESWRGRVSRKLAERSKIGDRDDYALWAESSHPNVLRAWVYPNEMGLGTVVIRCVGDDYPLLDSETLAAVQAGVDLRRNAGATVFVVNAASKLVPVVISGVSDPTLKLAIDNELELLFRVKRQQSALLRESEVDAAIQRHTLSYALISPTLDSQCTDQEVLVLGGITWLA